MTDQAKPPSGVEPETPPAGAPGQTGGAKPGPGGLSGGVDTGVNEPGKTGNNGREDG